MGQEQPFFSIIVPTYARPRQVAACLQSLVHLDYPRDRFEVVVVDDGSETPPEVVVAPFHDHLNITLLTQLHAGPAAARNTGAVQAKGKFLAFTDDDCAPAHDWLQALAERFATTPDPTIGGQILNALPDNPYSTASQVLIDYLYAHYNADPNQARFFASNNLALPADRFHAIGGFDTTLPLAAGEDRKFCDRWLHHGNRMIYAPEVLIYHAHPLTFRTFWRQHFNYGRGAFRFHQARARRGKRRIRLEPLSFYLNLLWYPFSQARSRQALLLTALLVMSQVASTAGFVWQGMSRTDLRPDCDDAETMGR
jgi:glycosyltransferase involved in cell wall biosynthesis